MSPLRAVLLDIDDTLLDTTSAMLAGGRAAMAAVWPGHEPQWYADASARFRVDPGGFFRRYTAGELDFEQMRGARLAEVAEHVGEEVPDGALTVYENAFRPAFHDAQRVYQDVPDFLSRCATAGLAVGALTNSSADATQLKFDALGIREWFQVVVTRDTLGFGKPDARVFEHACAALGAAPEETAYVGDELVSDALGARDAGLVSWWLRRPRGSEAASVPDHSAPDLAPNGVRIARTLADIPLHP
ncbi:HAD-IA family hydrolase [Calidifontibacter sp. DB0510]|uniref:HAD-IA family hydrolase n=1 Tax=Metallococcus carri TaxID=1656884 RepID=A0A967AWX9_9MICO|nr:HAD family hydrolase [Metallococcus carri]NHN54486.1 HAD-IA family hydrolase [Metallococcus carri]NOP36675.1 HAD-IA family hydrolase [Calidifontibacter sp. DB2511S]